MGVKRAKRAGSGDASFEPEPPLERATDGFTRTNGRVCLDEGRPSEPGPRRARPELQRAERPGKRRSIAKLRGYELSDLRHGGFCDASEEPDRHMQVVDRHRSHRRVAGAFTRARAEIVADGIGDSFRERSSRFDRHIECQEESELSIFHDTADSGVGFAVAVSLDRNELRFEQRADMSSTRESVT